MRTFSFPMSLVLAVGLGIGAQAGAQGPGAVTPVASVPAAASAEPSPPSRPPICSSHGRPRPKTLVERFIDAGCDTCWSDPATPAAPTGALAIDWVMPASQGDEAPLSAVALSQARERAQALGAPADRSSFSHTASRPQPGAGGSANLRVSLGLPINDYIGASWRVRPSKAGGPQEAWLVLLERLPAGTEGSPVERRLVRAALRPDPLRPGETLQEIRALRLPEGTRPERLELVAWVHDAQGRLTGLARADCAPAGRSR
jgi:hypothetical protein